MNLSITTLRQTDRPYGTGISFHFILILFSILGAGSQLIAQDCNNPLVGECAVVDDISGGLVALLAGDPDWDEVVDGDLTNFAVIELTDVTGIGNVSLISVKTDEVVSAGRRAGFVIDIENSLAGLLGADVLNSLIINTYLDNELQESAFIGGGTPISLNILGGEGSKRRVDFVTSQDFDEIELIFTGVATSSLLSEFHIYYAYHAGNDCDFDCHSALADPAFPDATVSSSGISGVCVGCSVTNESNVTNVDTTDFATINFGLVSLGATGHIEVTIGDTMPAGYDAGFAIEQNGILGLLSLGVLQAIEITTFLGPNEQEDIFLSSSLANVAVLPGGIQLLSFSTTLDFDRLRIDITSTDLGLDYFVYYAFYRPDSDQDGFMDCVDACPGGDDNFDSDGDGIPDDCDEACVISAGSDITACTGDGTAELFPAPTGFNWSFESGPSSASIDNDGLITGLDADGSYLFTLSNGVCSDMVEVEYATSFGDPACNDPLAGPNVIIDNEPNSLSNDGNVIDGDLSNFGSDVDFISILLGSTDVDIVSVKDTAKEYPAGTRVGYVISFPSGLADVDVLDAIALRTYLDDVLVEESISGGTSLANVDALGANGQMRISFTTSGAFDEVELVALGNLVSVSVLSELRVYYAFTEDADCPGGDNQSVAGDCAELLSCDSDWKASINYDNARTGLFGVACALCSIDSLSHVIDGDPENYASIDITVGALAEARVSVLLGNQLPAGVHAGFLINIEGGLLAADILDAFELNTYLNGTLQESYTTDDPLVSVVALNDDSGLHYFAFTTTEAFDEIQFVVDANLLSAGVASGEIHIYHAFIEFDGDGDGVPDCRDKCCMGNDLLDMDGDGIPDACDGSPVAVNDTVTLNEEGTLVVDVLDNDDFGTNGPGGDSISISNGPENGTAMVDDNGTPNDPTDDTIVYMPNENFNGEDSLQYFICDADMDCDSAWVFFTVSPVNDNPIAIDDINNTPTDSPASGNVLTNDEDPEDDNLSVNETPVNGPSNGTVDLNEDGSYTYTPDPGFSGEDSFSYEVCDDGTPSLCDTATVHIEVVPPEDGNNRAPIANADANQTEVNTPVDGDLLSNDNDPDGDNLTIDQTPVTGPSNGMVTINPDGTYSYTPDPDFTGQDMFTYAVCDDGTPSLCDTATVIIDVLPDEGNSTYANDDALVVDEDGSGGGNLLSNDFDPEGDTQTINTTPVSGPTNGDVTINPDGSYTYEPDPDFSGNDSFTYEVCDDGTPSVCDTATVTIAVLPVNDPPKAKDDFNQTTTNVNVSGNVLTNDSDPDNDSLIATEIPGSGPTHGDVTLNPDGSYTYVPDPDFSGEDQFSYEVCDNATPAKCDTATVFIEVLDTSGDDNHPPVANVDANTGEEGQTLMGDLLANDWDFDGDMLIITQTPLRPPSNGILTINADGTYEYVPNGGFTGSDTSRYEVCDDGIPMLCDTALLILEIIPDDGNSTFANDDAGAGTEGEDIIGNVLVNDHDPENDMQTVNTTPVVSPSNGDLVLNPDGSYVYTPDPGFSGNDLFVYEVCDDGTPQACDRATVHLTVFDREICLAPIMVLQGPYRSADGLMIDSLRVKGLIPLTEPYSSPPYNSRFVHVGDGGGETITDSIGVLGTTGADAIVDWVFIELRSKTDSTLVVATRSGLLQRDGDVVDVDGVSPICFRVPAPDAYYVAVRHRNHLSVMTLLEQVVTYTPVVVDFTTEALYRFTLGAEDQPAFLGDGIQQLWAGDVNSVGSVAYNGGGDPGRIAIYNLIVGHPSNTFNSPTFTYISYNDKDMVLDGTVSYNGGGDPGRIWLYNQVVGHSGNTFNSPTFVFFEQLPEE